MPSCNPRFISSWKWSNGRSLASSGEPGRSRAHSSLSKRLVQPATNGGADTAWQTNGSKPPVFQNMKARDNCALHTVSGLLELQPAGLARGTAVVREPAGADIRQSQVHLIWTGKLAHGKSTDYIYIYLYHFMGKTIGCPSKCSCTLGIPGVHSNHQPPVKCTKSTSKEWLPFIFVA